MRVRWTVPAAEDLESIKNYLQQHYPHFAEPTIRTIYQRIRSLKTSPNRGRPGTAPAQENLRLRRSPTSWSTLRKLKPSKSCTSITVRRIGDNQQGVGLREARGSRRTARRQKAEASSRKETPVMSVTFHIPGPLRPFTGGLSQVDIGASPATVGDALEALWALYPGMRDRMATEQGQIREHINLFVGNENVRYTGALATPLSDGADISIVPAISGG